MHDVSDIPKASLSLSYMSMYLDRNQGFVNRMQLPLLCEKSRAILLMLVGLTASRPAVRQNTGQFNQPIAHALLVFTAFFIITLQHELKD